MPDTQVPLAKVEHFQLAHGSYGFIRLPNPGARRRTCCHVIQLFGDLPQDRLVAPDAYRFICQVPNCREAKSAIRFLRLGWLSRESAIVVISWQGNIQRAQYRPRPDFRPRPEPVRPPSHPVRARWPDPLKHRTSVG